MGFWEDSSAAVELDRKGRAGRERAGLSVVVVVVLLLAILVGAGYVAAHAAAGDRVPRGTTISGVAVGGLTRDAAIARLQAAFEPRSRTPIVLAATDATGADRTVTIRPDQVGLGIDAAASVDQTDPRRSWRPQRLWGYFSDAARLPGVASLDTDALAARIRTMSGGFGAPPVDARVVFTPRGVREIPGQAGDAVSLDAAAQAVSAAYLSGQRRAEVPLLPARPDIDESDVAAAVAGFARPAMSAPVRLVLGRRTITLTPRQYAGALAMVPRDGHLVPELRGTRVLALVARVRAALGPQDATVRLVHGRPRVVASRAGTTFASATILAAFRTALTAHGAGRTRTVAGTPAEPTVTPADARRYGIRTPVAAFTAYVPAADRRRVRVAATAVDGLLLRPGDTLTMPRGSGPVAAAVLGAAFRAGLADVTPRLPVVLDPHAGDDVPVGLRFRADSGYGVLVDATVRRGGTVRVRLWSTRVWRVGIRTGARTDPVRPPVRIERGAGCRATPGVPGSTLAVTRVLRSVDPATPDRSETFHAVTAPVDEIVCR